MRGITAEYVEDYIAKLTPERDELMRRMEAYADEHDVPIIGPVGGQFLQTIAKIQRSSQILEAGTAIGYTSLGFARATQAWNGRITTLDASPDMAEIARANLEEGGVSERVDIVVGDALKSLQSLDGPFDLCFIDHEKEQYQEFLEAAMPKIAPGGVILADNVLRMGEVAEADGGDTMVQAMREFNRFVTDRPELESMIVPLRDGIALAIKAE